MFDSICIRKQRRSGPPIDLGFLAEAMIFYRDVHVVCDDEMLTHLLRVCGPDSLLAAVKDALITLSYVENKLGVASRDLGTPTERHGLVLVSSPQFNFLSFAQKQLEGVTARRGYSRRLAIKLDRHVGKVRWEQSEVDAAQLDFIDPDITDIAAKVILGQLAPGVPLRPDGFLRLSQTAGAFAARTSFDLSTAAARYEQLNPGNQFSIGLVLVGMFDALADVRFAARFGSELAVSAETAAIAAVKLQKIFERQRISETQLTLFQEAVFHEGRAIREAVNVRHRTFEDVLKLADAARPFKLWLAAQPETSDIRNEYLRAVSQLGWADKLPAKIFRWLLFGVAANALTLPVTPLNSLIASASISGTDEFLMDRLIKGWKPNQFIEGNLRPFVEAAVDSKIVP